MHLIDPHLSQLISAIQYTMVFVVIICAKGSVIAMLNITFVVS